MSCGGWNTLALGDASLASCLVSSGTVSVAGADPWGKFAIGSCTGGGPGGSELGLKGVKSGFRGFMAFMAFMGFIGFKVLIWFIR